jgi:hypothetical protein
MAEFGLYVVIRQLVNTKEWISACIYFRSSFICYILNHAWIHRARAKRTTTEEP